MPKKTKSAAPKKPAKAEEPAQPQPEPAPQHLHDESRKPLKAPPGGVPPNLPREFPGKGHGQFNNLVRNKSRSFRHQGR